MANENCLAGLRCPKCKQDERLYIVGCATFEVTDDGSEAIGDHEWDDDSYCRCPNCHHEGKVKDFYITEREESMMQTSLNTLMMEGKK